jgi:hypothetical protein
MATEATDHHRKAAEHFESAAKHHTEAAVHVAAGRHEQAANEAYLGYGDYLHARRHAAEAARLHPRHAAGDHAATTEVPVSSESHFGPALLARSRMFRKPS